MRCEKLTKLSIRNHPELSDRWVQERIAEDPSILGLGDLILKDKERTQAGAGRLDLLLQEVETSRRYEVEINSARPTSRTSSARSNTETSSGSAIPSTSTPP